MHPNRDALRQSLSFRRHALCFSVDALRHKMATRRPSSPFLSLPSLEGFGAQECPSPSDGHSSASSALSPIAVVRGHRGIEEEGTASLPFLARKGTEEFEEDPQGFAAFIARKYQPGHDWVTDPLSESPPEETVSG